MNKSKTTRQKLDEYFHFNTYIDRPGWAWVLSLLQAAAVIVVMLFVMNFDRPGRPAVTGFALLEALVTGGLVFAVTAVIKFVLLELNKKHARKARLEKLNDLEGSAKAQLRADYERALRTMVKKSGLKPADLKAVGNTYHDPLEARLFSDEDLKSFLGPMRDQTIRMTTPFGTTPGFAAIAEERLNGLGFFEGYFCPIRLICLFFATDRIVVGDTVFDSRTGDMQTRIRTVPLSNFQAMRTETRRKFHSVSALILSDWLNEHQFSPKEERRVAGMMEQFKRQQKIAETHGKTLPESPFLLERISKHLVLATEDGREFGFPMRTGYRLVPNAAVSKAPNAVHLSDEAELLSTNLSGFSVFEDFKDDPVTELHSKRKAAAKKIRHKTSPPDLEYGTVWSLIADLGASAAVVGICVWVMFLVLPGQA